MLVSVPLQVLLLVLLVLLVLVLVQVLVLVLVESTQKIPEFQWRLRRVSETFCVRSACLWKIQTHEPPSPLPAQDSEFALILLFLTSCFVCSEGCGTPGVQSTRDAQPLKMGCLRLQQRSCRAFTTPV